MSNRGLVVPVDGRRMISTAVGVTLIAAGAILRFAVPATFAYGLSAHVMSVIVMLAGIFGLLLSLLVWGPLDRRRNRAAGKRGPGGAPCLMTARRRWDQTSPGLPSAQRDAE